MLFRDCAGLPPYGPMASSFPPGQFREGYVVEFLPDTPAAWTCNFAAGIGGLSGSVRHPDGSRVVVFSDGRGYIVEPCSRTIEPLPGAIFDMWEQRDAGRVILNRQGLAFICLAHSGILWHTRRLSVDGFRDVDVSDTEITGLAWTMESWVEFSVDTTTGVSTGGLPMSHVEGWEQLARRCV